MREIIFRGKRVDNGEWVYGQLISKKCVRDNGMPDRYFDWVECNYSYIYEDNIENNIEEYPTKFVEVIPETIGQFTGLYDKDKKPIYEGDIIDIHQTINGYNQFVIEYKDYGFGAKYYNQKENKAIRWYEYDLDELFDVNESEKEIEVIGNIHDKERE